MNMNHLNSLNLAGTWQVGQQEIIYDETVDLKKFKWNEDEQAKKYIDEFLIRMNKLKVFL